MMFTPKWFADAVGPSAHRDDAAIDSFAVALKAKMADSRAKGRNGWDDPALCPDGVLPQMLREHVAKGDPRDVGVLAMMCWARDESTAAQPEGEASPDSSPELLRYNAAAVQSDGHNWNVELWTESNGNLCMFDDVVAWHQSKLAEAREAQTKVATEWHDGLMGEIRAKDERAEKAEAELAHALRVIGELREENSNVTRQHELGAQALQGAEAALAYTERQNCELEKALAELHGKPAPQAELCDALQDLQYVAGFDAGFMAGERGDVGARDAAHRRTAGARETLRQAPQAGDALGERAALVKFVIEAIAEIPDRDSPEDQPEMMLVTATELRGIFASGFEQIDASRREAYDKGRAEGAGKKPKDMNLSAFPELPLSVFKHEAMGPMWDRFAMQQYAMKFADSMTIAAPPASAAQQVPE